MWKLSSMRMRHLPSTLSLSFILLSCCAPSGLAAEVRSQINLGALPVAGFQYYAGGAQWEGLKVGDPLRFVREPDNPHDPNAVRIEWQGAKLGYVPRADQGEIARLLDKGKKVSGRIVNLHKGRSHWQRILFEALVDNSAQN